MDAGAKQAGAKQQVLLGALLGALAQTLVEAVWGVIKDLLTGAPLGLWDYLGILAFGLWTYAVVVLTRSLLKGGTKPNGKRDLAQESLESEDEDAEVVREAARKLRTEREGAAPRGGIKAGDNIEAGGTIAARGGIEAGRDIRAGGAPIASGKLMVTDTPEAYLPDLDFPLHSAQALRLQEAFEQVYGVARLGEKERPTLPATSARVIARMPEGDAKAAWTQDLASHGLPEDVERFKKLVAAYAEDRRPKDFARVMEAARDLALKGRLRMAFFKGQIEGPWKEFKWPEAEAVRALEADYGQLVNVLRDLRDGLKPPPDPYLFPGNGWGQYEAIFDRIGFETWVVM